MLDKSHKFILVEIRKLCKVFLIIKKTNRKSNWQLTVAPHKRFRFEHAPDIEPTKLLITRDDINLIIIANHTSSF